jgi:hypothetical protein
MRLMRCFYNVPVICGWAGKGSEGGAHEAKEKDRDREANVVAAATDALSAAARALDWTHYQQLLGQFIRIMQRNDSKVAPQQSNGSSVF